MPKGNTDLPAALGTPSEESKKRKKAKPPELPAAAAPQQAESEFTAQDFKQLADNEHARYAPNSKKIGHAVMTTIDGQKTAIQYPIPDDAEDTPEVRPLINIEEIEPFRGMHRYRAETPDGKTPMFTKRSISGRVGDTDNQEDIEIACFSPNDQKGKPEPFWGSMKETPLFNENLSKAVKKDLEKDLKEMGKTVKGGDILDIEHASVPQRDLVKTRTPDQNTVMGESARDAYENFFDRMADELHPDMKARLKRAFTADIKAGLFKNSYRPEWLHLYGWSLMPVSKDPQKQENLGAGPKWANTQMMVLERIIKWFALNSPESLLSIQPKFEMLLDSELVQHIDFKVKVQIKDRYVQLMQKIDPFLAYPLFPKASDLAQGAAITYGILHDVAPVSHQAVIDKRAGKQDVKKPQAEASHVGPMLRSHAATSKKEASAAAIDAHTPARAEKQVEKKSRPAPIARPEESSPEETPVRHKRKSATKHEKPLVIQSPEKSSVQIYTTLLTPDYDIPWRAPEESSCTGSGVIIENAGKKYILTNAHVVENNSYLQVRLADDRKRKYEAKCKCVSYQCDLALLEVDDPEFNQIAQPADLGEMVKSEQKVMTVGFPMGGSEISKSKGIVSRIEVRDYCMSGDDMLQVQIDAAVNPGNSGGAVFSANKVVGIAFQGYDRQGLGFMIPTPIVYHFLQEAFSGKKYRGFPIIPFVTEELENDDEREYYKLGERTGVRIRAVDNLSDAYQKLKTDDILLSIDGMPISNEGTIDIPDVGNCINLVHATHSKFIGDSVSLQVLRKNPDTLVSEVLDIDVVLDCVPGDTEKVGATEHDKMPTYFINSGICFQPLTRNYMEGAGGDFEEIQLESGCLLVNAPKKNPDEQIILISHILICNATQGYDKHINQVVTEINGKPINNMHDVVLAMEGSRATKHVITLSSKSKIIVQNMSAAELLPLLKRNHIPSARSEDLIPHPAAAAQISPLTAHCTPPRLLSPGLFAPKPSHSATSAFHPMLKGSLLLKRKHSSTEKVEEASFDETSSESTHLSERSTTSSADEEDLPPRKRSSDKQVKRKRPISDEEDIAPPSALGPRGGVMPGERKYRAFLDEMEERYKDVPMDEEDDEDFAALDEEIDDDEEESNYSRHSEDEAEEVDEEEAELEEIVKRPKFSSARHAGTLHQFFRSKRKDEDNDMGTTPRSARKT